ncbi:MAG: hypothetical protein C4576_12195 [Desulfobacteraceae bacterium]|nr:MAG: hypothetical protein C4576_12195 [Desulfobacteraceae bacterium]
MECPHCNKEIEGRRCSACGAGLPLEARYCMQCGVLLEEEPVHTAADPDDGPDLENRVLCPDGTCTGIIVNGKCSECGRSYPAESGQEK